jgi:hypothetical protein
MGKTLTEKSSLTMLDNFVSMMRNLTQTDSLNAYGTLHLKNLYVHDNKLVLCEPVLVTDKV